MPKDRSRFDAVLKALLRVPGSLVLSHLTHGIGVKETIATDSFSLTERHADLVFRLSDDSIFHLEIQATNDPTIGNRMATYSALLGAEHPTAPFDQAVLYVGHSPLTMSGSYRYGRCQLSYDMLDIRELQAKQLLATGHPSDTLLAVLASGGTHRLNDVVRQLQSLPSHQRKRHAAQFEMLRRLRGAILQKRKSYMPITLTIAENDAYFRELYMARGKAQIKAEILTAQMRQKFGAPPRTVKTRLATAIEAGDSAQIDRWLLRILSAPSIESLFED